MDENGHKFCSAGVAFCCVPIIFWFMRFFGLVFILLVITGCGTAKRSMGTGIIKVLPHYLDNEGQHTDGPTLLHRDVYQRELQVPVWSLLGCTHQDLELIGPLETDKMHVLPKY